MLNAEFEDCIELDTYKADVLTQFGVDLGVNKFKGNNKWSDRVKNVFMDQGKPWSDSVLAKIKNTVGQSISRDSKNALNSHKRNSIDALVLAIERMIKI